MPVLIDIDKEEMMTLLEVLRGQSHISDCAKTILTVEK